MPMGGIHDNHVYVRVYKGAHTVHHVPGDADTSAAEKPSEGILCA